MTFAVRGTALSWGFSETVSTHNVQPPYLDKIKINDLSYQKVRNVHISSDEP